MNFINGLSLLLIYQLAGEISVLLLGIPVPGPVLGMIMLFLTLAVRGCPSSSSALDQAATTLLSHLSLLFVPAGVGIMVHYERISNEWLSIGIALILSTVITMATTALIMLGMTRLLTKKDQENESA